MSIIVRTQPNHYYSAYDTGSGTGVAFELTFTQSDVAGYSEASLAGAIKAYLSTLSGVTVTAMKLDTTSTSL